MRSASFPGNGAVVIVGQRRVAVPERQRRRPRTSSPSAGNSDATGRGRLSRTAAISASTTSSSTKFDRLRDEIGRWKWRQRSSISLSLASVLVISANRRTLRAEHLADRLAPLRGAPRGRGRTRGAAPRARSTRGRETGKRSSAIVSSKRRIQAARRRPISRAAAFRGRPRAGAGARRARRAATGGNAPMPGRRILGIEIAVLEAVDLKREEQQLGRNRVDALLHRSGRSGQSRGRRHCRRASARHSS